MNNAKTNTNKVAMRQNLIEHHDARNTNRSMQKHEILNKIFRSSDSIVLYPNQGRYFGIKLPGDDVVIRNITVAASDSEVNYQLFIYDREPTSEYHNSADVMYETECRGRRIFRIKPGIEFRANYDPANQLHCALFLQERPIRFDIEDHTCPK